MWTGEENFSPTGIRSLGPTAGSESLYRLAIPATICFYLVSRNGPFERQQTCLETRKINSEDQIKRKGEGAIDKVDRKTGEESGKLLV